MCGAVRYTVQDEFVYALNFHCSQCRRATGGAFKHFAGIARESSMRPSAHIFVGSKAPWHTITDDLPQHAEFG